MNVQPYLSFEGRAEEAIEFYRKAIGAELLAMMRFKDMPAAEAQGIEPHGTEDKVMHAAFRIGDTVVFASDGRCTGEAQLSGIALSLTASDVAEAERLFAALSDGGQVSMPMTETFFAKRFGMVDDRFGVGWMVLSPMVLTAP